MTINTVIATEDRYMVKFAEKTPLAVERGSGVHVWDISGKKYLDFTSGWAVTSLGHAHPVLVQTVAEQAGKIMQNPDGALTYAPARARLLRELAAILPDSLHHFFFTNSGAEGNDAAVKLARKITGRKKIVAAEKSFHGRTIGTTSITGQAVQRDRYEVLVPHSSFVPFNNLEAAWESIDGDTAAVIIEPVQGEGGVWVPEDDYLEQIAGMCRDAGALLIVDEIQTGFWRTGPAFASIDRGVLPDMLTMAKGIAGGFPFGAVAVSGAVAGRIEVGDHGGTYCGNPLGCAVAAAAIQHLRTMNIGQSVREMGNLLFAALNGLLQRYPDTIKEVRGKGLLAAIEFADPAVARRVNDEAMNRGLLLNIKHGRIIRIFPALIINREEMLEGLAVLAAVTEAVCTG